MKDLKYLAAYIIPILTVAGITFGGWTAYLTLVFSFGFIPLVEWAIPESERNLTPDESSKKLTNKFFDALLFLNVPIIYGTIAYFLWSVLQEQYTTSELAGNTIGVGILLGACGINVAHELGHRQNKIAVYAAQALLLPAFYMHFFIEHNWGHHKDVATPNDPATARFNESIYVFWARSVTMSYVHAWKLERKILSIKKHSFWSFHNRMIVFLLLQLAYATAVFLVAGWLGLALIAAIGVISFLLLETINYVEHYGLLRKQKPNGEYERVLPKHSWNSNQTMGRIVLYELTRHSDHHFIAAKKYQTLDHHDDSLQLPQGYPACMLMSLLPPLWFGVMNKRIERS